LVPTLLVLTSEVDKDTVVKNIKLFGREGYCKCFIISLFLVGPFGRVVTSPMAQSCAKEGGVTPFDFARIGADGGARPIAAITNDNQQR
jgi:hypothetical protein